MHVLLHEVCRRRSATVLCALLGLEEHKLAVLQPLTVAVLISCAGANPSQVVIVPFERCPIPFCCCSNRANRCVNCCGLVGPLTGAPLLWINFSPQPKHPQAFVAVAMQEMARDRTERGVQAAIQSVQRLHLQKGMMQSSISQLSRTLDELAVSTGVPAAVAPASMTRASLEP